MFQRNLSHPFLYVVILMCVALALAACNTEPKSTPLPPLPTVLATATRPPTAVPTAAPKSESVKTTGAKTVDEVMKSAPTSQFMDGKHLAKGLQCQACHTPFPPKGAPEVKVCLSCHKGSYTAMAEVTAKVNPNPHTSHEGEIPCTDCHKGHEPFVYGCGRAGCHTDYSSTRFK